MIHSFPFELKQLDDKGLFNGFASVYGVEDLMGDVIEAGAFAKTIQARPDVPLLLQHKSAIGTVQLADSPQGLVAEGRLTLSVQEARDSYELVKSGALRALSIGFTIVKDRMEAGIRKISEARLWEVSLVPVGMNPAAGISAFKGMNNNPDVALERAIAEFRQALEPFKKPGPVGVPNNHLW